jgi:hypothetical protein
VGNRSSASALRNLPAIPPIVPVGWTKERQREFTERGLPGLKLVND